MLDSTLINGNYCCKYTKLNSVFNNLKIEECQELMDSHKIVTYKPGQIILKQGTPITHYPIFISGFVKAYYERSTGSDLLMCILGKDIHCGCMNIFPNSEHHLTYQAVTRTEVCLFSSQVIESIFNKNADFARAMYNTKQQNNVNITKKLAKLTYENVESRVAEVLLYLSTDIYKSPSFALTLSRQDLADIAAISKESFIRTIKTFRDNGFIKCNGKNLIIQNHEALTSFMQGK